MGETFKDFGQMLADIILYASTQNDAVNYFLYYSSIILTFSAAVGLIFLLILHPRIRKRERPEDKFMFWECVLVLILAGLDLFGSFAGFLPLDVMLFVVNYFSIVSEFLYMLAIMQWMVFVDYSLYHSKDHIRRCYKFAILPILVVMGFEIVQFITFHGPFEITDALITLVDVTKVLEIVVEYLFVLRAVQLVVSYRKETRQPRFLSLGAFIVPFIIGMLIRSYDAAMMAIGVLLTCVAASRRDWYLDRETNFYNRRFLQYLATYRDRNRYVGGNVILMKAPGRKEDMARILKESKPGGSSLVFMGDDTFLLLSESLRGSAVKMAVMVFTEAAEACDPPFTPAFETIKQGRNESAEAFVVRLTNEVENGVTPKGVTS